LSLNKVVWFGVMDAKLLPCGLFLGVYSLFGGMLVCCSGWGELGCLLVVYGGGRMQQGCVNTFGLSYKIRIFALYAEDRI